MENLVFETCFFLHIYIGLGRTRIGVGKFLEPDPKYIDLVQQYCTKQYIYHLCLKLLKCDTCDTGMNFTLIDIWISFSPNMESCGRLFLFLPALKIATNVMFLKVFKIPASVLYFCKCIFACRGGFYISAMTNIFAIV